MGSNLCLVLYGISERSEASQDVNGSRHKSIIYVDGVEKRFAILFESTFLEF
jgi:hypothetical protein